MYPVNNRQCEYFTWP